MMRYPDYKQRELSAIGREMPEVWKKGKINEQSVESRNGKPDFVFYEGVPSVSGLPGIYRVMARAKHPVKVTCRKANQAPNPATQEKNIARGAATPCSQPIFD